MKPARIKPRVVDRIWPENTRRRFVAQSVKGAAVVPWRLRHRLNARNVELLRFFRRWTFTCNVCGYFGVPIFDMPDLALREAHGIGILRETLTCRSCLSSMRHRALVSVLLEALGATPDDTAARVADHFPDGVRILDTDSHSALSRIFAQVPSYLRSEFVPNLANGAPIELGRIVNVDLSRMPFPAESFDLILTSDVMEHVRDYATAHAEISRCLTSGGKYIFTVPFNENLARNRVLVDATTDQDIPLEPRHRHGDPIRGGIKAYRIFGRELIEDLAAVSLPTEYRLVHRPASGILRADVFISQRR